MSDNWKPACCLFPSGTRVFSKLWKQHGTVISALFNVVRVRMDNEPHRVTWHTSDQLTASRQQPGSEGRGG